MLSYEQTNNVEQTLESLAKGIMNALEGYSKELQTGDNDRIHDYSQHIQTLCNATEALTKIYNTIGQTGKGYNEWCFDRRIDARR